MLSMKPFWSANLHSMDFVAETPNRPDRLRRYYAAADVDEEGYPALDEGIIAVED
jgi:hypothetical protein